MSIAANPLKIVIVGHVDHGKSTLIGRLLFETDCLPTGKLEEITRASERRGMPLEWSFALDALQAERDQAVTIDTTQIRFRTALRDYVIIDAPGHREFLKNMISGAASADAAILVVDAEEGMREQTRRHAYLLHLIGLRQVAVVINKMDQVGHAAARFAEVRDEVERYLEGLGLAPAAVIPISARHGDNLARPSAGMAWYEGDPLLQVLDRFGALAGATGRPLRLPIQDVYKFDHRRILAGRIESGVLRVGDELLFSPANRTARVRSIEPGLPNLPAAVEARAGQSVGITLDEQIFVERGDVASHVAAAPKLTTVFRASLFWLAHQPLTVGALLKLKLGPKEAMVTVQEITKVIDTETLAGSPGSGVPRNGVAEVVLRARELLALDEHISSPTTGRFTLVDVYDTVGGGVISMEGFPDQREQVRIKATNLTEVDHLVTAQSRAVRYGQRGAVIWLTGLSGAGKSTLAMLLERRLFDKGRLTYVLDGDNMRTGLNADLGFSPEDRRENIRRVGAVAALFADSGLIVITAFISPYRADRERARAAAPQCFHEIYVKADLATCEQRDPKGLYRKARAGQIADFTGISAPYEEPEKAELVVDTARLNPDACVDAILAYLEPFVRAVPAVGFGEGI